MTKISTDPPAFRVRPAQPEEAGAFFAQTPEQNAQMGAIGCVRMDFGRSGTAFWHTWHPRGREELNSPEFKAELQQVVDTLRETVLKDLSSMRHFFMPQKAFNKNGKTLYTDADRVCTRMKQAEEAIGNTASTITEWSENAVRQIVERVTVLSADEILVRIKGGAEIRQRLE